MANAAIAYTNVADDATVTATSAELLLPVSRIQDPHVARKWRSLTPTDAFIVDMGSQVSIDTVAVMGLTADTVRIRVSNSDTSGLLGDVYDSGVLTVDQAYKQVIVLASITGQYFRFDLTISEGYVEAGRLFMGNRTTFSYNYNRGWQRSWLDRSTRSKTRGGQTQIFNDVTYRSIDVTFDLITEANRNGFIEDIDRVNALKTDVLFMTDPASTNLARDSIWGLMTALSPVVQPFPNAYTKQYQLEERL